MQNLKQETKFILGAVKVNISLKKLFNAIIFELKALC